MSIAPLPAAQRRNRDLLGNTVPRRRALPSPGGIARRRWMVRWSKRLLPVVALALLASLALWPELDRQQEAARYAFRRGLNVSADGGRLTDARYRGVDDKGEPYAVTATTAVQDGAERVNLTMPKADVTTSDGNWFMVQAKQGVYIQHEGQLDLQGDATLYRQDGTTMISDTATVDLKAGVAAGSHMTHAEGPFGTLDAQGFALVDKGTVIQFTGPARLVLNGSGK
jgi:lipopolysaccharide export system protein LptC